VCRSAREGVRGLAVDRAEHHSDVRALLDNARGMRRSPGRRGRDAPAAGRLELPLEANQTRIGER
jgi:hypothetical protein